MWVIVFSANASSASPIVRRPSSCARLTDSRSWTAPSAITSPARSTRAAPDDHRVAVLEALEERRAGHVDEVDAASARIRGPRFG